MKSKEKDSEIDLTCCTDTRIPASLVVEP